MDLLVKMIFRLLMQWMDAHPASPFTRFMKKSRGPRQDVRRMTRIERLRSALACLFWGIVFLGAWLLLAWSIFQLNAFPQDNAIVLVIFFGLALFAAIGLLGGIYLLLRVIV